MIFVMFTNYLEVFGVFGLNSVLYLILSWYYKIVSAISDTCQCSMLRSLVSFQKYCSLLQIKRYYNTKMILKNTLQNRIPCKLFWLYNIILSGILHNGKDVPLNVMVTYWVVEVYLHFFLTWALDGGKKTTIDSGWFTPGGNCTRLSIG
jgi:hypothetical protein